MFAIIKRMYRGKRVRIRYFEDELECDVTALKELVIEALLQVELRKRGLRP